MRAHEEQEYISVGKGTIFGGDMYRMQQQMHAEYRLVHCGKALPWRGCHRPTQSPSLVAPWQAQRKLPLTPARCIVLHVQPSILIRNCIGATQATWVHHIASSGPHATPISMIQLWTFFLSVYRCFCQYLGLENVENMWSLLRRSSDCWSPHCRLDLLADTK